MIMWQTFLLKERTNKTRKGQFEKNTVNLNQSISVGSTDDDEVELIDIVASNEERNSKWTQKIFSIIEPMLSEDLKLQMAGFTQVQIANMKKVSQAQVSRNIQNNIKKIQAKLSEGDMLNYYKTKFMKSYFN